MTRTRSIFSYVGRINITKNSFDFIELTLWLIIQAAQYRTEDARADHFAISCTSLALCCLSGTLLEKKGDYSLPYNAAAFLGDISPKGYRRTAVLPLPSTPTPSHAPAPALKAASESHTRVWAKVGAALFLTLVFHELKGCLQLGAFGAARLLSALQQFLKRIDSTRWLHHKPQLSRDGRAKPQLKLTDRIVPYTRPKHFWVTVVFVFWDTNSFRTTDGLKWQFFNKHCVLIKQKIGEQFLAWARQKAKLGCYDFRLSKKVFEKLRQR